jgi:hypothetical protein
LRVGAFVNAHGFSFLNGYDLNGRWTTPRIGSSGTSDAQLEEDG